MQWFALVWNWIIHHTNHGRQWFSFNLFWRFHHVLTQYPWCDTRLALTWPPTTHGVLPVGFSTFQSRKATLPFQGELQQRCEWVQLLLQTAIFMHLQPSAIFSAAILLFPFLILSIQSTNFIRKKHYCYILIQGERGSCDGNPWQDEGLLSVKVNLQAMLQESDSLTLVVWRQEWQAGTVQVRSQA